MKTIICLASLLLALYADGAAFYQFQWATTNGPVQVTNIVKEIAGTVTGASPTVTGSNFISGTIYTNKSGRMETVSCPARIATGAVSGNALAALCVDNNGAINFNVLTPSSIFGQTTTALTVADFIYGTLSANIPNGASYVITNLCTGSGNVFSFFGTNTLTQF